MGIIRSSCTFCEKSGVDKKCGQCGTKFHIDCAEKYGHLELETKGMIRKSTRYKWHCPDCGRISTGEV